MSDLQQENSAVNRSVSIGTVFDERYEILELIGSGANGIVYRAMHIALGQEVAVKILRSEYISDHVSFARFKREAQIASQLRHPNLLSVRAYGITSDGQPYLVMDLLQGHSLANHLQKVHTLDPLTFRKTFLQILDALEYAHRSGVIHRDIKPGNIVLTADGAKLIDLGLAKMIAKEEQGETITKTGVIAGTPKYMSPEQCRGMLLTPASDIYSLAAVMYESLTGKAPFTAESDLLVLQMHLNEPLSFPSTIKIPNGLAALITKAMDKDAAARPQSAQEFTDLLAGIDFSIQSAINELKTQRKSILTIATAIVLMFLCVITFAWSMSRKRESLASSSFKLNSSQNKQANSPKKLQIHDTRSSDLLLECIKSDQRIPEHKEKPEVVKHMVELGEKAIAAAKRENNAEQFVLASLVYDGITDVSSTAKARLARLFDLEKYNKENAARVPQTLRFRTFETIGEALTKQKKFKEAITYFRKAAEVSDPYTDEKDKVLRQCFSCYNLMHDLDSMEAIMRELNSHRSAGDVSNELILTEALLASYYAKKNSAGKLTAILKSISTHSSSASDRSIVEELKNVANYCSAPALKRQKETASKLSEEIQPQCRMEAGEFRKKFLEERQIDKIVKPDLPPGE